MLRRRRSWIPFLILLVAGGAVMRLLPLAIVRSTADWATILIGVAVGTAAVLLWVTRRASYQPTLTAALWMIPLLYSCRQQHAMGLLALLPVWWNLSRYLPRTEPPRGHAYWASGMLQSALVLGVAGWMLPAVAAGSAGLVLILRARRPHTGGPWFHGLSAGLALVVTYVIFSPPAPPSSGGSAYRWTVIARTPTMPKAGSSENAHLGIVLRPKTEAKEEKLKIPPPPRIELQPQVAAMQSPLEIPFRGVYWLFQEPLMRPPSHSPEYPGAPAGYQFRSDDTTPLRLEAIQTFSQRFAVRSLRAIDVRLRSVDTYADTMEMRVYLIDSKMRNYRMRLAEQPILDQEGEQTLHFEIPADRKVEEFDEILLRVMLSYRRQHIAPRIEVQSFRFYPGRN